MNLVNLFKERLELVGGQLHLSGSWEDTADLITRLITVYEGRLILAKGLDDSLTPILEKRLRKEKLELVHVNSASHINLRDFTSRISASVAAPVAGIAESGTVVYSACSGVEEAALFAPQIHVAVLKAGKLTERLEDLAYVAAELLSTRESVFLVSGPSCTADIEGELIRGVHGPRMFHVILVEDEE